MTKFVLRPERMGLTSTFTRSASPLPLDVADDPADGIAGGDRHQFLAGLERNHGHAPRRGIDLIERAIGEGPHLNRVDVAFARGRDTGFGVRLRHAHGLVGRLRRRLGFVHLRQRLHLRRHRQHLRHFHHFDRRGRLGQRLRLYRLIERDGRWRLALRGAARQGRQQGQQANRVERPFVQPQARREQGPRQGDAIAQALPVFVRRSPPCGLRGRARDRAAALRR